MVFAMLMAAADTPDPSRFKDTDLYRRCLAAGVVPASAAELADAEALGVEKNEAVDAETIADDRTLPLEERIEGMWCPACAWVIGNALGRLAGVCGVQCDFSTDRLSCRYDPARVRPDEIRQAVTRLGYRVAASGADGAADPELRREFVRLALCALLSANVMMLSWALYSGFFTSIGSEGVGYLSWPIAMMATVVMIYGGGPVLRKAWSGIRHGAPGMEALIVLGAGSAYFYSLLNAWMGSLHLYFDTAAMLVTLLLLGKLLERQAKQRVRRDLEGFQALQPTKVRLCGNTGDRGRYVAMEQLGPGDFFRVVPEETAPADGRVVNGRGRVDMSAITGEPRPVAVTVGDRIISGSRIVNGELTVRAERTGNHSLLGQMIATVRQSLSQRTALESRTDLLLAWFVPLMAVLAGGTGIVGFTLGLSPDQSLVRAVTVLVIACPCALGIAIPLARVAGIAGAARRGILVKDFDAFEQVSGLDTLVLDKTGTVTLGRWSVEKIELQAERTESEVLALAMGLEEGVDHTIARAIRQYGRRLGVTPAVVQEVDPQAEGVGGRHQGQDVRIGTRRFAGRETDFQDAARRGSSLSEVVLSVAGKIQAVFYFGDTLREGMAEAVAHFERFGLTTHLVSGDAEKTTRSVAAQVGISNVRGGLLPEDKAAFIHRLQATGRRVVMAGDGINDAPALSRADLAVAVRSGSPLAQHTAAVILMAGHPAQLLDFLQWARRVDRKVRWNLRAALIYNLASIPIAMAGLLNPLVAVTAMLMSSLTVIGNTLLLVRKP